MEDSLGLRGGMTCKLSIPLSLQELTALTSFRLSHANPGTQASVEVSLAPMIVRGLAIAGL